MRTVAARLDVAPNALAATGRAGGRLVHANLERAQLVALALRRNEASLSAQGALVVRTGAHSGRSVQDKFVVDEPQTHADIWWGEVNRKMPAAGFDPSRA